MQCPTCGIGLDPDERFAALIVCPGCRSAIVNDTEALRVAGTMAVLPTPRSGLQVGIRGTVKGIGFTAVGRVRYRYPKGYWDEWFLRTDDGRDAWISEDGEGLRLEERIAVEKFPAAWADVRPGKVLRIRKNSYRVTEKQIAVCEGGEGQLPFVVEPDEEVHYLDFAGRQATGTIEYTEDGGVTVFLGRQLGPKTFTVDGGGAGYWGAAPSAESLGGDDHAKRVIRDADRMKPLKCHGCGAALPAPGESVDHLSCDYCGTTTDLGMKQLVCMSCNASIPVGSPDTAGSVNCPACGTQHSVEAGQAEILKQPDQRISR